MQHIDTSLKPSDFIKTLSDAILATVDHYKIRDHVLLARAFTILSLFSASATDAQTAAEYGARAVSNIHTMQLQLETSNVRSDHVDVTQTFLCVWALDRLNAVFHSRPSLMHIRDIGRDISASIAEQQGCFGALLVMCNKLDSIINLYRPCHQSCAESGSFNITHFDELIAEANAGQSPAHLLGQFLGLFEASIFHY